MDIVKMKQTFRLESAARQYARYLTARTGEKHMVIDGPDDNFVVCTREWAFENEFTEERI